MLLTILAFGGVILGATTIAGLLMFYEFRQATNLADSAKAIFAADTGIEWALYDYVCGLDPEDEKECFSLPILTNGATTSVRTVASSVFAVGSAGKASRAFKISFK